METKRKVDPVELVQNSLDDRTWNEVDIDQLSLAPRHLSPCQVPRGEGYHLPAVIRVLVGDGKKMLRH